MKVRFLSEAEVEIDEAVTYYNAQRTGLGAEFAGAVRDGLVRIKERTKAWQLIGLRVRRYRLSRFPYGLVFAPLLSAGSAQGVKAGDQFALVQRVGAGAAARDERSAVVRVVRSGPEGSSAIPWIISACVMLVV